MAILECSTNTYRQRFRHPASPENQVEISL
jgi:hypothetical protein